MSADEGPDSLTIPAELGEIDRARLFLKGRLREGPLDGESLFQLDLALFEILVNIVRYGYPAAAGEIRLTVRPEPESVYLEIRDRGVPFNPLAAPPPALDDILGGRKIGGLGVHLVRTFSDELTYRREGGENVLVLRKVFNKEPGLSR
ncbi:MAG: ATP-binding protein [Candidatus Aminicenantes bacterium]|nr:ATP-binding protein [Candidatus Aminicenantes bacterium]